jgi:hypothetical protein
MRKGLLLALLLTGFAAAQSTVNLGDAVCVSDALATGPDAWNLQDGSHSVNLSWTAPVGGAAFNWYRVYRGTTNGGPYTLLADCVQPTSYVDATAADQGIYYYVVTAVGLSGESLYSNQTTAAIPIQDALTVQASGYALPSDAVTIVDQLTASAGFKPSLGDSISLSDSIGLRQSENLSLHDAVTPSDSLAAVDPGGVRANLSDTLTPALSEAVTAFVSTHPAGATTLLQGAASFSGQAILVAGSGIIPASLFGLHFRFNENQQLYGAPCPAVVLKYPNLPYGSLRLWDTDTRWQNLNLAAGTFNFACLDPYLATARSAGVTELILTLSSTPHWAASNPSVNTCDYSFFQTGDCSPPADLNSDGTGTNQDWRDYIYNLGNHIAGLSPVTYMAPTYFEMWNEFTRGSGSTDCTESNGQQSWLGTCEQLVRMAQDANCILTGRPITITATGQTCTATYMNEPAIGLLPSARILTPNAGSNSTPDIDLWGTYLATTGALLNVDRLAVHAYAYQGLGTTVPDGSSVAGTFVGLPAQYAKVESLLPGAAFGKNLWSSEGSWGSTPVNLPDATMEEGYVARYYLVGWSSGFRELYWYAVNNSYGTLIDQNGINGCNDGGTQLGCPTLAATGWTAVYHWMVGNQMTQPCAADATLNIWTCGLLKTAGAVKELAVWDSSQGSAAVTVTVTVPTPGAPQVQATLMNGAALSAATNWVTVPIVAGASYISFSAKPGWGYLPVTGITTTTQPNDTLILSDLFHVVSAGSGIAGEISGNSFYSYPGSFTRYYTLDSGAASFPLSGGTVAIGWKPILLSP